jgi:hypothetical protein
VYHSLLLLASLSVSAVGFVFTIEQVKIQGDSGGQIYNLRGEILVVVREKIQMNMCLVPNGYRDRAV